MKYPKLMRKIVEAYIALGFRPNPGVWIDKKRNTCNPLVALALHKEGKEKFMSTFGFYNKLGLRRYITDTMFRRNWMWAYAFIEAFDGCVTKGWTSNESYRWGYRVGKTIRHQLRELYYKKKGPTDAKSFAVAADVARNEGNNEETSQGR